jgi:hypothetical protein
LKRSAHLTRRPSSAACSYSILLALSSTSSSSLIGIRYVFDCIFNGGQRLRVLFRRFHAFHFFQNFCCVFGLSLCACFHCCRVLDFRLTGFTNGLFHGDTFVFRSPGFGMLGIDQFALCRFRHMTFFALFKMAEVVADRDADLFQCLLADSWNLFQLFGGHIRQSIPQS